MINIIVGIIRIFFVFLTPLIIIAVIISLISDTIRDGIKRLFGRASNEAN